VVVGKAETGVCYDGPMIRPGSEADCSYSALSNVSKHSRLFRRKHFAVIVLLCAALLFAACAKNINSVGSQHWRDAQGQTTPAWE
jgi:hypothetical protein